MRIGSHADFAGLEAQNMVFQNLSAAPSSPKKGQTYFNTSSNVTMVWNGTTWRPFDAAGLSDGSVPLSALSVDPRARSTHTGTQAAATISDLAATVQAYRLDQFAAPTASVSWNSKEIINLLNPTTAQSAATKNYVDAAVQSAAAGIDSKASVRTVSTTNITLSGTQTIDGVALVVGNRHLATGQTTASQNGVYVVAAGAWTRASDADQSSEITPGAMWFVEEGTAYGKTQWRVNNSGAIALGTTAIFLTLVLVGPVAAAMLGLQVKLTTGLARGLKRVLGVEVTLAARFGVRRGRGAEADGQADTDGGDLPLEFAQPGEGLAGGDGGFHFSPFGE